MISSRVVAATTATLLLSPIVASWPEIVDALVLDDVCGKTGDDACHLQLMQLRAAREVREKGPAGKMPVDSLDSRARAKVSYGHSDVGQDEHDDVYDDSHNEEHISKDENLETQGLGFSSHEHFPDWPLAAGEFPADIPWDFEIDQPIKILLWTDWGFLTSKSTYNTPNCEFMGNGQVTYDTGVIPDPNYDISDVDVIIFHMSNLGYKYPEYYTLPANKPEGQLWIAACGEPYNRPDTEIDCRLLNDTKTMERFDATSTFSLTSDFPAIQDPIVEKMMRMEIPDFASRGPELATMVFSDCLGKTRNAWAEKVIAAFAAKGQDLLSYGGCYHTATETKCENEKHSYNRWINRCSSRPFKIVPENIVEPWYVTEKVWDALAEGAIPVYWGAPEVKLWVPEGSIIYADDFPSLDALVDKLISFSAADFAAAYAWKSKPASEWTGWHKAWRLSHYTLIPRLCEAASKAKSNGGKLLTPDKE